MNNITGILKCLGKHVLKIRIRPNEDFIAGDLEFLSACKTLRSCTAYVTTADTFLDELQGKSIPPECIFLCSSRDNFSLDGLLPAVNIILVAMDKIELFSRVNSLFKEYAQWRELLINSVLERGTTSCLAETCADISCSPVFILNSSFKLIASSNVQFSLYVTGESLKNRGYINADELRGKTIVLHDKNIRLEKIEVSRIEGQSVSVWIISQGGEIIYSLLIEMNDNSKDIDYDMLAYFTSLSLIKLRERLNASIIITRFSVSETISDILRGALRDGAVVSSRLEASGVGNPACGCYRMIIAEPEADCNDVVGFSNELISLFPGGAVSSYEGNIVCIWPQQNEYEFMSTDEFENTDDMFKKYSFKGFISFPVKSGYLRIEYLKMRHALEKRKYIAWVKDMNLIPFENVHIYCIIDNFKKACDLLYGIEGEHMLRSYIHPTVRILREYDMQHNSNLCDVLRLFCITNGNVTMTAQRLFMHKNTVSYKLKQIKALTGDNLLEPMVNLSLHFSIALMRYIDQEMG